VLVAWQPHENRGTAVPVSIEAAESRLKATVNMRQRPPIDDGFGSAGRLTLQKGEKCVVVIGTDGAGGFAHADAVLLVPAG
jgi:hypothetical protein